MKFIQTILLASLAYSAHAAKTSAIIESSETHLYVSSRDHLTTREFVRIKIMDEDGYIHAVFRDYYNSFKKIKSVQYTVFDANGKRVKKLVKGDALDIMANASYEIADAR